MEGICLRWSFEGACIKLILFSYSSVASTTFKLLHCVPIQTGPRPSTYLFYSAETECFASWQLPLLALLACLLLTPVLLMVYARAGLGSVVQDLSSPFVEAFAWWHGVLLMQLLLLSVILVFCVNPYVRALSALCVVLLALVAHLCARPFSSSGVNTLQTSYLCCLVILSALQMPDAVLFSAASPVSSDDGLLAGVDKAMAVLLLLPVVAFAGLLVTRICRKHDW